eukprot:gnl/Dysnectes_brevis/5456_a7856_604.p1 GENE.gnl/Dysnectes_brevis/5456_a7856_604~~gnl/Dysnectes_brevis/5456_a7856_604.p1  ORF type:complete len:226 (+),score=65.34 gnl/Dysnectes_brevis/5456_a7856_604:33-710(+)
MFIVVKLKDIVKISPQDFGLKIEQAVENEIVNSYCGRIIQKVGMCVSLSHISSISEARLFPNEGAAFVTVHFSVIAFRPFINEIISGTVAGQTETEGILVSLNFFNDILVPPKCLPVGVKWDHDEKCWVWPVNESLLYFDLGEEVRLKVMSVRFTDDDDRKPIPGRPQGPVLEVEQGEDGEDAELPEASSAYPPMAREFSPFLVIGTMQGEGLGVMRWWSEGGGE